MNKIWKYRRTRRQDTGLTWTRSDAHKNWRKQQMRQSAEGSRRLRRWRCKGGPRSYWQERRRKDRNKKSQNRSDYVTWKWGKSWGKGSSLINKPKMHANNRNRKRHWGSAVTNLSAERLQGSNSETCKTETELQNLSRNVNKKNLRSKWPKTKLSHRLDSKESCLPKENSCKNKGGRYSKQVENGNDRCPNSELTIRQNKCAKYLKIPRE